MYRQYEDPRALENELFRVKEEYSAFMEANSAKMESLHPNADSLADQAIEYHQYIDELEQRVNAAWEDLYEGTEDDGFGKEEFMDTNSTSTTNAAETKEFKEITVRFPEKLVGEPFLAKDGNEYVQIKLPNEKAEDKSPWATFVLKANHVHKDQFSPGMWAKLPENGSVTLHKSEVIAVNAHGEKEYANNKTKVSNVELKKMFDDRCHMKKSSVLGNLDNKKKDVDALKQTLDKSAPQKIMEGAER